MEFLPRTMGMRPRLACEVRAEGVVAARAEDASGVLSAVARAGLSDGLTAALRKALDAVAVRGNNVTLVVPDSSLRVLLLDFDALPNKPAEALPVVRFRLKKLLPFDADDAAVSYQVMSSAKAGVRVVAVAMPRETLTEYEGAVREAGFEPGAVLPSTLAALAGLGEDELPVLLVNAGREGVTTAIVKAGVLLLHRSVDLRAEHSAADLTASEQEPAGFDEPIAASVGMQTAVLGRGLVAAQGLAAGESELAQAVSVAAAYFEDTLETSPGTILAAGPMGAEALAAVLDDAGVGPVRVREIVETDMLGAGAASAGTPGGIPLGWLAGVRGALAI